MNEISESMYLDTLFEEVVNDLENNEVDTTELQIRYDHGLIDTITLYQNLDKIIDKEK